MTKAEVIEWMEDTVPHTQESVVKKFEEEANELVDKPDDEMEFADVQILLWYAAYLRGIDIDAAVDKKMSINQSRTYHQRADGTWKHD